MMLACFAALLFIGCGSDEEAAPPSGDAAATEGGQASAAASTSNTPPANARKRNEVYVDEEGRKWLGDVPYDVFYDDPLTVAANQTPLNGAAVPSAVGSETPAVTMGGNSPTDMSEPPDPVTDEPAESGGTATSLAELLPAEALDNEIRSIRNFLNQNLQSVGTYNSSMLMIPPKAATLAALSELARTHPGEISWKEDAGYLRDLAGEMNLETLQRGAKSQRRLRDLFDSANDILNRSRPAGLPEPGEQSYVDVAEMRLLMMRMEEAEKRMRTEAGSESLFGTQKDLILHESRMLATITRVIVQPGYGYEDDPDFVSYVDTLVESAQKITEAAESNDFASYDLALSKISTTCQSCHSEYKND